MRKIRRKKMASIQRRIGQRGTPRYQVQVRQQGEACPRAATDACVKGVPLANTTPARLVTRCDASSANAGCQ
jgi:hypothetical protein